jgi:Flp pilus assembly protein TadG
MNADRRDEDRRWTAGYARLILSPPAVSDGTGDWRIRASRFSREPVPVGATTMAALSVMSKGRFGDRSGVAAGLIALMLMVFIGMAALSVDLGVLLAARTETQRAADAGALSGALSLWEAPGDVDRAKQMAIDYANQNVVHGAANDVLVGDVDVILDSTRVRVRVHRTSSRSSAIVNLFARLLGFPTSNVSAEAAAHMGSAAGVNCPLPFVVVDRWWETGPGRLADDLADTWNAGTDVYNEGPLQALPGSINEQTGYGEPDRGRILRIYPPDPSGTPLPGWAYLLELNDPGGSEVRAWIKDCDDPSVTFEYGDQIEIKNGMTTGPVDQGFTHGENAQGGPGLITQDPNAYWGTGPNAPPGGCVMRPGQVDADGNQLCVSSPRIKPAFLISPSDVPTSPGNTTVTLRNFVGLFTICVGVLNPDQQSCHGNIQNPGGGVWVRFVDYRGVNVLPPNENPGSLVRSLQLVE